MREIKFRAWDGEDIYLSDDIGNDFDFQVTKNGLTLMLNEQFHECGSGVAEEYWNYVEKTDAVFMQFTGLKDKNGVEIYDGDIIPYRGQNYQVEMCGTSWTLKDYEECDYYGHDAPELQDWSEFEVIGNIHQNPELLTNCKAGDL